MTKITKQDDNILYELSSLRSNTNSTCIFIKKIKMSVLFNIVNYQIIPVSKNDLFNGIVRTLNKHQSTAFGKDLENQCKLMFSALPKECGVIDANDFNQAVNNGFERFPDIAMFEKAIKCAEKNRMLSVLSAKKEINARQKKLAEKKTERPNIEERKKFIERLKKKHGQW